MAELATVARPYAEATFKTALERNSLGAVSDGLQVLAAAARDEQLRAAIGNPRVTAGQRKELLASVLANRVDETVKSLISVLVDARREVLIGSIQEQFEALKRDHERVLVARITSAQPLTDAQRAGIVSALESRYGKRVEAELAVDAELLGGARVQIGDQVIHASVRDALAQMAAALAR